MNHPSSRFIPILGVAATFLCAPMMTCADPGPPAWLAADSEKLAPAVIALRRDIHANPELSNGEERTAELVAKHLRGLGLEVKTGVGKHGIVALLQGGKPGPCVALRADMDALPIEEAGDLPFKSKFPGVMHACGHDAHTAIALGVASLLAMHKEELAGSVKFLFQPAEEGMPVSFQGEWGAKAMMAEGALENPTPKAIFALHCSPLRHALKPDGTKGDVPFLAGQMGCSAGPTSANSDRFSIVVNGRMAHGSTPHRGVDAIQVAAAIITELQTIRSRHTDSQEPVVVTVGTIRGGQRENIIADRVEMAGTVRTHSTTMQTRVAELISQIASGIASAHGAKVDVVYRKGYPAVINDAALTARCTPLLHALLGSDAVFPVTPSMGGEDFAYFAQKVPGLYLRLGTTRPGNAAPAGLHTPDFVMDETCLLTGVRAMTTLILAELQTPAGK